MNSIYNYYFNYENEFKTPNYSKGILLDMNFSKPQSSKLNENKKIKKTIILGDKSVGKTCLFKRLIRDSDPDNLEFESFMHNSLGLDFKNFLINVNSELFTIQLWDSIGLDRYKNLIPNYLRNVSAIIFAFDLTNLSSFNSKFYFFTITKIYFSGYKQ